MDLPPKVGCTAQLRARLAPTSVNPQGEVVCTDTVSFNTEADRVSTVNVLMYCGLPFQAPVAQLDLAADFSFNVANFCPDLFVLNCIDTELDVRPTPAGDLAVTACQVRFRDGDLQCGSTCDPQVCTTAPEGLRCEPQCLNDTTAFPDGCPTEPTTTVTCIGGELGPFPGHIMNCDGSGQPAANCVFNGDTLGVIGAPPPGPPPALGGPGPGEGGFFVACVLCDDDYVLATGGQDPRCPTATGLPLAPGAQITCTAKTTDGDNDCDKTKTVALTCPGLTPCQAFGGDAACDDQNECTVNTCNDASGTAVCETDSTAQNDEPCTPPDPGAGLCEDGVCVGQSCAAQCDPQVDPENCDASCETANECTFADVGICDLGTGDCGALTDRPNDFACDSGAGTSGDGTCDGAGTCETNDTCTVANQATTCGVNQDPCLQNQCNTAGAPWVCETVPDDGGSCDANGLPGVCQGGSCVPNPPYVNAGTGDTTHRAGPRFCVSGNFPYIAAGTSPEGTCALCLDNSCSGGTNALRACTTLTSTPGGPGDECPGGTCIEATPGPIDCALDCFTFVCTEPTDILFPKGGDGGACVYPGITTNCPFLGCQVVSNTLKNQLSIDTFLSMDVTATGLPEREVTVEYNVRAVNAGLALAGPLANLNDVTLITNLTGATLNFVTTKLDPLLAGTSVDAYTGTGDFVLTAGFAADLLCDGGDNDGLACDTNVQCPNGGTCDRLTCDGGDNDTLACTDATDCPNGGTCDRLTCDGGDNDTLACDPNAECPNLGSTDRGCANAFQLNPTTNALLPNADPDPVVLAFDETIFNIALVIKSSGAPLDITGNNCTFSNEPGTCSGGANDLDECDPAAPDGSTGLADCTVPGQFPPNNVPGTCEVTDGAPVSMPTTFP
jgi:hypothetical protein